MTLCLFSRVHLLCIWNTLGSDSDLEGTYVCCNICDDQVSASLKMCAMFRKLFLLTHPSKNDNPEAGQFISINYSADHLDVDDKE